MTADFLDQLSSAFQQNGYSVFANPAIPNINGRLYAVAAKPRHIGPIKFINHTLMVEWENDLFGRMIELLEVQKAFSTYVNQSYKIPHAWRMTLPNLGLVVISRHGFDQEARECALNRYFIPWQGGETGQIILVDLVKNEMVCHTPPFYKQAGSIPLEFTVSELERLVKGIVPGVKCVRSLK